MGLDNGLVIKKDSNFYRAHQDWVDKQEPTWAQGRGYSTVEICYWRKCWNVRAAIFDIVGRDCENNGEIALNREQVSAIVDYLAALDENSWEDGDSIWSWDEIKDSICEQCATLTEFLELAQNTDKIFFYDSY